MKHKKLTVGFALLMALVMTLTLASVSFAETADYGGKPGTPSSDLFCVDGYVINHRELPVDGTKTEPPLVVELVDESGRVLETMDVDSHGYFKFEDLEEGSYNFRMQLPTDWDGIVPAAERSGVAETGLTMLEVPDGPHTDKCWQIVFKIRRLFDITAIKWEENLDGAVSPGEGWEITFEPIKDPFVKKQTDETNASGGAVFTVTPGKWKVYETVKDGWTPITPPTVYLELDQYAPPGAMDPVVFKNREPVCHAEIVVEKTGLGRDENGGLVWLGPLAGFEITLSRPDGKMYPITKVTDGSGKVTFDGLKPGVYEVEEWVPAGWKAVSDNPQTVVLMDCESERVLFENEEVTGEMTIKGRKIFQAWEPPFKGIHVGLSGWVITATLKGTDNEITTTTDALGRFEFTEEDLVNAGIAFPGATVEVCEESRDNWIHVTHKCVTVMFPYPLPDDYPGEYVKFVNMQDPPLPGMSAPAGASCSVAYTVQPGDSLSGIALRYGTTVNALAQANGIANPNLVRYGTTLCVQ